MTSHYHGGVPNNFPLLILTRVSDHLSQGGLLGPKETDIKDDRLQLLQKIKNHAS